MENEDRRRMRVKLRLATFDDVPDLLNLRAGGVCMSPGGVSS